MICLGIFETNTRLGLGPPQSGIICVLESRKRHHLNFKKETEGDIAFHYVVCPQLFNVNPTGISIMQIELGRLDTTSSPREYAARHLLGPPSIFYLHTVFNIGTTATARLYEGMKKTS